MVAVPGVSTNIIYNALEAALGDIQVILEAPQWARELLRRRIRRLGWLRVAGQLGFLVLIHPALRRAGRGRIRQLIEQQSFKDAEPPARCVHHVESVNSNEA